MKITKRIEISPKSDRYLYFLANNTDYDVKGTIESLIKALCSKNMHAADSAYKNEFNLKENTNRNKIQMNIIIYINECELTPYALNLLDGKNVSSRIKEDFIGFMPKVLICEIYEAIYTQNYAKTRPLSFNEITQKFTGEEIQEYKITVSDLLASKKQHKRTNAFLLSLFNELKSYGLKLSHINGDEITSPEFKVLDKSMEIVITKVKA